MLKTRLASLVEAIGALFGAAIITLVIGSFVGYPVDPDGLVATKHRIEQFYGGRKVVPAEESDRFFAELTAENAARQDPPPAVVAILKWYSLLFGSVYAVLLLALRPASKIAVAVSLLASCILFFFVGPQAAFMPVVGAVFLVAAKSFFRGLKRSQGSV